MSLRCRSKELLAKGYLKGWEPKVEVNGVDFPFTGSKGSEDPTLHFLWGPPTYNGYASVWASKHLVLSGL